MIRRLAPLVLVALWMAAACGPAGDRRLVEFGGETMGSTWSLKVVDATGAMTAAERQSIEHGVQGILQRIETLMSTWDPDSELSRFNRSTSLEPFALSPETYDVFTWAVALAAETGGAFDVTVAPIVEAWGFGPAAGEGGASPGTATLTRLRAAAGVRHLALDEAARTVRKRHPEVRCDFSALAPGYAADRITDLLVQRGLREFLVDVGGEMVARGLNAAKRPWQIAIERPDNAPSGSAFARVVPLTDEAIATSGDYRNFREVDGRRLAHIIDPRTAQPIAHPLASATVIDLRAVRADALATALMVLGPDEGLALAERLDVPALLLVRQPDGSFEERRSSRMAARLGAP